MKGTNDFFLSIEHWILYLIIFVIRKKKNFAETIDCSIHINPHNVLYSEIWISNSHDNEIEREIGGEEIEMPTIKMEKSSYKIGISYARWKRVRWSWKWASERVFQDKSNRCISKTRYILRFVDVLCMQYKASVYAVCL